MKYMATDVARAIVAHVKDGGWLGSSWPYYLVPRGARVTQFQLDSGWDIADDIFGGRLQQISRRNFEAGDNRGDEE